MTMEHASATSQANAAAPREPRWLVLAAFLAGSVALGGALYAIDASQGKTALALPGQDRLVVGRLSPQGWGFFTKDPQDELLMVMERDRDEWQLTEEYSGAPSNAFGFRRELRARGAELGLLVQSLTRADQWHECKQRPERCAASLPVAAVVPNPTPSPLYCGELVVVRQRPVPWAWSGAAKPVVMPSFLARIEIQC